MRGNSSGMGLSTADVRLDLDTREIQRLIADFQPTSEIVGKAMHRALRRTAGSLRLRVSKALVPELQLRRATDLRRRLRQLRLRIGKTRGEVGIWIGLNDLAVSQFKGVPREYTGGAKFRQTEFPGAFVARLGKRRRSIYKRSGRGRFPIVEQTLPIKDIADPIIEDDVFPDVVDLFMKHFLAELRARTVFGVGS